MLNPIRQLAMDLHRRGFTFAALAFQEPFPDITPVQADKAQTAWELYDNSNETRFFDLYPNQTIVHVNRQLKRKPNYVRF